MENTTGTLHQKKSISAINVRDWPAWLEIAFLASLGVVAVIAHARFRLPIQFHGRHGIEWMALLLVGRIGSRYRWASTVTSTSAALTFLLPIWSFGDPYGEITYFLAGPLMDIGFMIFKAWQDKLWFYMLLGALVHPMRVFIRLGITGIVGWKYASLVGGIGYPLLTHMISGLIGGFVAGTIILGFRKFTRED